MRDLINFKSSAFLFPPQSHSINSSSTNWIAIRTPITTSHKKLKSHPTPKTPFKPTQTKMNKLNNILSTFSFDISWTFFLLYFIMPQRIFAAIQHSIHFGYQKIFRFMCHRIVHTQHNRQRESREEWKEAKKKKKQKETSLLSLFIILLTWREIRLKSTELESSGLPCHVITRCYQNISHKKNIKIIQAFIKHFCVVVVGAWWTCHLKWSQNRSIKKRRRTKIKRNEKLFSGIFLFLKSLVKKREKNYTNWSKKSFIDFILF